MKRLVFALLIVTTTAGKAQDMQFGLKGGLTYSVFPKDGPEDWDGFGFHIGGLMDIGFSELLNFRTELVLADRGIQNKTPFAIFTTEVVAKYNTFPLYLTLPILYQYKAGNKFSLFVGPQFSFLLSNTIRSMVYVDGELFADERLKGEDATNFMRKFELGLAIGAEYKLADQLNLGVRYIRGIQSTGEADGSNDFYNGVQLSLLLKL